MTSEIDSLQERVDAIRATADPELAARAYRALSVVFFSFTREKKRIERFPIAKRITRQDVEWFIQDLSDEAATRPR